MRIKRGKQAEPSKDLICGVPGVGKSSLAANYPNPLFIDVEGSTEKLDVARTEAKTYSELIEVVNWILTSKESDEFETIVFDTIDWIENIVIKEILRVDHTSSIADHKAYGFGMGDKRIDEFFRENIITRLEQIRAKGKNIVLVAHSEIKGVEDPIHGRFDQYQIDTGKTVRKVIQEWANNVLFLNFDTMVEYRKGLEKNKLKSVGRYIHTEQTPQFQAKNRDNLPTKIKLTEDACPYFDKIGTVQMKEAAKTELKELENSLNDCNSEDDVRTCFKTFYKLLKNKDAHKLCKNRIELINNEESYAHNQKIQANETDQSN